MSESALRNLNDAFVKFAQSADEEMQKGDKVTKDRRLIAEFLIAEYPDFAETLASNDKQKIDRALKRFMQSLDIVCA